MKLPPHRICVLTAAGWKLVEDSSEVQCPRKGEIGVTDADGVVQTGPGPHEVELGVQTGPPAGEYVVPVDASGEILCNVPEHGRLAENMTCPACMERGDLEMRYRDVVEQLKEAREDADRWQENYDALYDAANGH